MNDLHPRESSISARTKIDQKGNEVVLPLVVVKDQRPSMSVLLGRNWLEKLQFDWKTIFNCNLSTEQSPKHRMEGLCCKYPDVSRDASGVMKHFKARRLVTTGVQSVPFTMKQQVARELEKLGKTGIMKEGSNKKQLGDTTGSCTKERESWTKTL